MQTFSTYTTSRHGVFLGLTLPQLGTVVAALLPVAVAVSAQKWSAAGIWLAVWVGVAILVAVPFGTRSAVGWCAAAAAFSVGGLSRWTSFRSKASRGALRDLDALDMPGALAGVEILDGPPMGIEQRRIAIIKNSAARTWAITAEIHHDGLGMVDDTTRQRYAQGMTALIEDAARGELVDEVHLMVRANSDDCVEREMWLRNNFVDGAPASSVASQIEHLRWSQAGVRMESFITVVVPESRLSREARHMGGSVAGRMSTLQSVAAEMDAVLVGEMGATRVRWLTSPELAVAVRLGFAPGDRAGLMLAQNEARTDPTVAADVPWALAGPTRAHTAVRHYAHDAWATVTSTVKLPGRGAPFAMWGPVLWPTDPQERRAVTVVFPIEKQSRADRKAEAREFGHSLGQGLKNHLGVRTGARDHQRSAKVHQVEHQLALGSAMTHAYVLCATTVPAAAPINEFGRRLDASVRRAGLTPQRLDMSQDLAFVAATIPIGISLGRNDRS